MSYPPSVAVDTSREAAHSIAEHVPSLQIRVLNYVRSMRQYGATAEDIETALALDGNTVRPRVIELMRAGKVVDSGQRRALRSGRRGRVLVCPEFY